MAMYFAFAGNQNIRALSGVVLLIAVYVMWVRSKRIKLSVTEERDKKPDGD